MLFIRTCLIIYSKAAIFITQKTFYLTTEFTESTEKRFSFFSSVLSVLSVSSVVYVFTTPSNVARPALLSQ